MGMWKSICEYLAAFGYWVYVVLVANVAGIAGLFLNVSNATSGFPTWLWVALLTGGLVVAPFLAFHKMRVQRDDAKKAGQGLVLTVTAWGIGIAGQRGYPDNLADPDLLRLEVAVYPASRPPTTLDILVGRDPIPIPAVDWSGKVAATFTVHFGVSEWRHKGEQQVELVAKEGGGTHSAGRIPIDFNMEVFGRHVVLQG